MSKLNNKESELNSKDGFRGFTNAGPNVPDSWGRLLKTASVTKRNENKSVEVKDMKK